MKEFFQFFEENVELSKKPWLILGKGPSFAKRIQYKMNDFHLMSLNHVVREMAVKFAHIIDLDVVDDCSEAIINNAEYLIMPWYPHISNQADKKTLSELCENNPTLQHLNLSGRLICYNLSTAKEKHPDWKVVNAKYFSAEAALGLLVGAGIKKIRSLGIDGGNQYSKEFTDLNNKTLLTNNRNNFDEQFQEIAKIIFKSGTDFSPLDLPSPIRVFIASTEEQMLSTKVLEYSIKKYSSMSVEIILLNNNEIKIPIPKSKANKPRTPFSFQRFLIPQLTKYHGRAIYLDSDMQVFRDIKDLWRLPFHGANLLTVQQPEKENRNPQFSVMLLNCETLDWNIKDIVKKLDEGQLSYHTLMHKMTIAKVIKATIDPAWNSLEQFNKASTALLHYTDMNTQPWISKDNLLGHIWFRDLFEAIDAGFITDNYVQTQINLGYARPSLGYQVKHRIDDSFLLPKEARQLDKTFKPAFIFSNSQALTSRLSKRSYLKLNAYRAYRNSPIPNLIKFSQKLIRHIRLLLS